jgi:hypothetical protein
VVLLATSKQLGWHGANKTAVQQMPDYGFINSPAATRAVWLQHRLAPTLCNDQIIMFDWCEAWKHTILEVWINAAVIHVTDDPAHRIQRPHLAQAPVLVDERMKFVTIAATWLVIHPFALDKATQVSHGSQAHCSRNMSDTTPPA